MEPDKSGISQRLLVIRKELGLTQKELASAVNISQSSYCDMENGEILPRFELIYYLAAEHRVNLSFLFFGRGLMFADWSEYMEMGEPSFTRHHDFLMTFLESFRYSNIYRFLMMSYHHELFFQKRSLLEDEIRDNKKKAREFEDRG